MSDGTLHALHARTADYHLGLADRTRTGSTEGFLEALLMVTYANTYATLALYEVMKDENRR